AGQDVLRPHPAPTPTRPDGGGGAATDRRHRHVRSDLCPHQRWSRNSHSADRDLRLQHRLPVHAVRPGGGDAGGAVGLPDDLDDLCRPGHAQSGSERSGGMKGYGPRVAVYTGLGIAVLVALFPFWWMLVTSLKQPIDIFAGVSLIPQHLTFSNYSRLFGPYHFGQFLRNSVIVVSVSVAISLVIGSLAAYALARFRLRLGLNRHALVATLLVRMLPPILLVVPIYIVLGKAGLLDSRLGLIIVYTGLNTSFVIWMMQSFL